MPLTAAQIVIGDPYIEFGNTHRPGHIVGSGPVWSDLDAGSPTYTETWSSFRTESTLTDTPLADVQPPVGLPTAPDALHLSLAFEIMIVNDLNATGADWVIELYANGPDFDNGLYVTGPAEAWLPGVVNEWQTVVVQAYPSAQAEAGELRKLDTGAFPSIAEVSAFLASGCHLSAARVHTDGAPAPADYGLRIRDFIGSVWWTTPAGIPPLRGYPRDDRLRGSIRGFPTPTSRQQSARATGYL